MKTKVALSGFTKWHYNHNIHNHDDQQDDDYDHKYDDDDDDRHDGDYEWPVGFAPWRPPLSDRCPPWYPSQSTGGSAMRMMRMWRWAIENSSYPIPS